MKTKFCIFLCNSLLVLFCSDAWPQNLNLPKPLAPPLKLNSPASLNSDLPPEDQEELKKIEGRNKEERKIPADYGMTTTGTFSQLTQAVPAATAEAHTKGVFGAPFAFPLIPIHTTLLPDGKVLSFGTDESGTQGATLMHSIWDPNLGYGSDAHTVMDNTVSTDIFCAGQSVIASTGETLIAGGDATIDGVRNFSNNDTTFYNYHTGELSNGPKMAYKRWYATLTGLANGEILITGGRTDKDLLDSPGYPEVYSPETGLRTLTNAFNDVAYGNQYNSWHYPPAFQAPNGKAFILTHETGKMFYLDTAGSGSLQDVTTKAAWGSDYTLPTLMYAPGKILSLRRGPPVGHVQTVDLNGTNTPTAKDTGPVSQWRYWSSLTVLADGKVMVSGGSSQKNVDSGVAYQSEIWDPQTGLWTIGASAQKMRLYHSGALLLPDATVLTAGGGAPGPAKNLNGEIFYPPYLYDEAGLPAARPSITSAPDKASWNQQYAIGVDTPNISRVTLVRTGSATHSINADQRFIELQFTQPQANQLTITTPQNSSIAPPGFYMLFAFNEAGVPSVAKIIHFTQKVTPTLTLSASPLSIVIGESATISWNAANADSCTASGGWNGQKALSGSEVVKPTAPSSYTLACSGPNGTVTRVATVNVLSPLDYIVGNWTLDEASGLTAYDSSGFSNNGTLVNNPAWSSGQFGGALAFDGTNRYVEMNDSPSLSISSNKITLTAWVKSNNVSTASQTIIAKPYSATTHVSPYFLYGLTIAKGGKVQFNIANSTTNLKKAFSDASLSPNTWYHVAGVYDGKTMTVYVNGTASSTPVVNTAKLLTGATPVRLGVNGGFTERMNGIIDNVHIYPIALTQKEIAFDMTYGNSAPAAPTVSLTANPSTISSGETSQLSWSSTNATSCTASGDSNFSGSKPVSGTASVTPGTTTTYTLSCTGNGSTASKNATVTVASQPAPTVSLSANPASISSGGSSQLSWTVANAASCTASGGWSGDKAAAGGSETVTPGATTTYTLSCTGNGSTVSSSATVTVSSSASSLAAHWKLDETGTDTTASDASGSGNSGSLINFSNPPSPWIAGQIGGALSFNGSNSYVNINNSASLNLTGNALTLEAWVYSNNVSGAPQTIVAKPVSATSHVKPYFSYGLSLNTGGKIQFALANGSTSLVRAYSASSLLPNTWYHVAGVYNGTSMVVYVNAGTPGTSVANTASIRSYSTPVRLGVNGGFGEPMNGLIDDVRIYSRALSQSEIASDMNGGTP